MQKLPKLIYLDYAATTPVDPQVMKVMAPFFSENFGNPSSLYRMGKKATEALSVSRQQIAEFIGAETSEIIFTAGGTESVNLAIRGAIETAKKAGIIKPHIITSKIEHDSVLECINQLGREGAEVSFIDNDKEGFINPNSLKPLLKKNTVLVSIIYANNEVGTIEPIAEIGKIIKSNNRKRTEQKQRPVLFHTDACQALGLPEINVQTLGVDMLSANSSKVYGPKQVGFLYIKKGIELEPILYGGGQERNLRSGTENVPGIVGFGEAVRILKKNVRNENASISHLQKHCWSELRKNFKDLQLNGPTPGSKRLVNNLNFRIPGIEGESLMFYLDSLGFQVSTGSACSAGDGKPSRVLLSLKSSEAESLESIRVTLGRYTTKKEIDSFLKALKKSVVILKSTINDRI